MKYTHFSICLLFLILFVNDKTSAQLNDYQTGQGIGLLLNSSDAIISDANSQKLANKKNALRNFKESLNNLKNGNLDGAFTNAKGAISSYHAYAPPYLIAAYACSQNNDPLNAHRYLMLYKRMASKKLNRDLAKEIPADFITQLNNDVSTKFKALSDQSLHEIYKKEEWKQRTLDVGCSIAARSFGDFTNLATNNANAADFDMPLHFFVSYSEFIWLNKKNAFSTLSAKNMGIDLNVGFDYNTNLLNANVIPDRTQIYFAPGFFYHRFYISLFKLYHNSMPAYPDANPVSMEGKSSICLLPEIRYYTFFGNYASKFAKNNPNPFYNMISMYFFFKSAREVNSGSVTSSLNGVQSTTTFYLDETPNLFGIAIETKRIMYSVGVGWTDFYLDSQISSVNGWSQNYLISSGPFTGQVNFAYKIL